MTYVDEVTARLASSLASGPMSPDLTRVDSSVGEVGGVPMLVLMLRTAPRLSEQMKLMMPYQIPAKLVLNCLIIWSVVREFVRTGHMELFGSEAMVLAASGMDSEGQYGVRLDKKAGIYTFPRIRFPSSEAESRRFFETFGINNWTWALMHYPEMAKREPSVCLWVVHVPDIPVDELDDTTLDQLIRLSLGWNYLQVGAEAFFVAQRATLRQMLASAHELVSRT